MAVKDIVAQDQADRVAGDEFLADQEGVGQAARFFLDLVGKTHSQLAAVAQQGLKAGQVGRGGDDQDVADAGQHQRRERVVDHGLVIDGQQLLAHHLGDGMEPGAVAAGQNDAFHHVCPPSFFMPTPFIPP